MGRKASFPLHPDGRYSMRAQSDAKRGCARLTESEDAEGEKTSSDVLILSQIKPEDGMNLGMIYS